MKNYSNRLSCIYVRICNKFGDKQSLASSDMGNFLRKCEKLPSYFYFQGQMRLFLVSHYFAAVHFSKQRGYGFFN